ncbi:lysine N(6)-hydroxylase/L-ornithine N(5)-oxygenase family protein [Rahnella sp. PAMC 25559]|uniref:lysine N(6)-hydroxylase/L-ornithine N(5)-oxygenase family protein n=1 Tax=Rahnella sp. PAMC 25559 TaxID=3423225 RepID=UPI003D670A60
MNINPTTQTYDFIAIGIGPFNLGLACLTEPVDALNGLFLDQNDGFDWHTGMMLESAHLQTPFMADLVTLADPTSRYSFLNYLKQQGKLYSFYIRENFFMMRKEFNQYCQWACEQLTSLQFSTRVELVTWDAALECYLVHARSTKSGDQQVYRARRLVLGTGPSPWMPACARQAGDNVHHSSAYLPNKEQVQNAKSITVVGSGQSAGEIYYDLLSDIEKYDYHLTWVTRAPRFYPLEYSKLTLEMTSPEYIDYFHELPMSKRDQLNREQKGLYKGINASLINDIYDLMYTKRLDGPLKVDMYTHSELTDLTRNRNGTLEMHLLHHEQQQEYRHKTESVILATGYSYQPPQFIEGIHNRIRWDEAGRYAVNRNYSIDAHNQIFVQNAELHTHGFVTPDLGMACYRNSTIIREMLGKEVYTVEKSIAFQTFCARSLADK